MGALQPMHLLVVLVIVLLIFGPGTLPELGRAVGDGMRELKRATSGEADTAKGTPGAASAAPASDSCPSCATLNGVSQTFCGACGTRLAASA